MRQLIALTHRITGWLDCAAAYGAGLILIRLLMAWEFGKAGLGKLRGDNWFGNVRENFLFPFSALPADLSWFLATWLEILGAAGLLLGLFTRFWAFSLVVISVVAISAVHWPAEWNSLGELWESYRVTKENGSGNFRVPLLFIAMLLPLVFSGAGKLSLDHLLKNQFPK